MTTTVIQVSSPAFVHGQPIPREHTCDGANLSPPVSWSGAPEGTVSFALTCDDPDAPAGTWVHWVLSNLPATVRELPLGVPAREVLENGARQGRNDFHKTGYGGPCPPRGKPHRYVFRVYALDALVQPGQHATLADLERSMEGHVLARGELMGTYQRE